MAAMTAEEAAEWGKTLTFEIVWAAIMETDRISKENDEKVSRKFEETAAQMKQSSEETEAQMKRSREETAAQMKQSREEAEAQMKRSREEAEAQMKQSREETAAQMKQSREETEAYIKRLWEETAAHLKRSGEEVDRKFAEAAAEISNLSKNVGGINNSLGKWMEQMTAAQLWKKFDKFGFVFTKDCVNVKFRDKTGRVITEVDIFLENGAYVMLVEVKLDLTVEDVEKHLERIEKVRHCMNERGDTRTIVAAVAGAIVSQKSCEYALSKGLYVLVPSGDSVSVANVPDGFIAKEW
jgi:flagellar biosynthesis GTPase FlhF